MAAAPHRSSPAFERKQKIARRICLGVFLFIACLLGVGVVSGRLDPMPHLSTPVVYLLSIAAFCFAPFMGFMDEPLTVPARLQLWLYAGAVLVGLAYAWVFTNLVWNYWYGFISLLVISAGIKAIAATMIKRQHAQHK